MYQDFSLSHALLDRGHGRLAGMAARKAFWQLEDVVRAGDMGLLQNLIGLFRDMMEWEQDDLLRALITQLAHLARQGLPARHPLLLFFSYLAKGNRNVKDVMQEIWACFIHTVNPITNGEHFWIFEFWTTYWSVRNVDSDPEQDSGSVIASVHDLSLKDCNKVALQVARYHNKVLREVQLIESEELNQLIAPCNLESMACEPQNISSTLAATTPKVHRIPYLKTILTKQAMDRGEWTVAEEIMHSHIQVMEEVHGSESLQVIRELWSLEKVLTKAGDTDKATSVAKDAVGRAYQYLAEVPTYM
jgi:hypothetical protein